MNEPVSVSELVDDDVDQFLDDEEDSMDWDAIMAASTVQADSQEGTTVDSEESEEIITITQIVKKKVLDLDPNRFHRFQVLEVKILPDEIVLSLQSSNSCCYICYVRGLWCTSIVRKGDYVSIKTPKYANGTLEVDNYYGILIVNPDTLISATSVAGSVFCMRKSWLGEKFRGWSAGNKVMLIGTMVHELFQAVCLDGIRDKNELDSYIKNSMKSRGFLLECFASDLDEKKVIEETREFIPHILDWSKKYMDGGPSMLHEDTNKIEILKVHDIEDNIWKPELGLKGKVDVTAEVKIHGRGKVRHEVLPIELKTGASSFSNDHQGQTTLYELMMENRYDEECNSGLLLYLKNGAQMKEISLKHSAKSALLQRRNELAFFSNKYTEGPDLKESLRFCSKCEHLLDCCLVTKLFEPEKLSASQVHQALMPDVVGHLNENHMEFFKKWVKLLSYEIEASKAKNVQRTSEAHFWNETSLEREKKGLCLGKLEIVDSADLVYTFRRSVSHCDDFPDLLDSLRHMQLGQRIAISLDRDNMEPMNAMAFGYIQTNESDMIVVSLDKKIQERLIKSLFRLDVLLDSLYNFMTNFTNLLRLMTPEDAFCSKLRSSIVDKTVPQFRNKFSSEIVSKGKKILKPLNTTQQRAVLKTLSTSDYLLIQGLPGCGKTQTIVAIIRLLVALKKTVLVTCFTHSAVDNILLKLKAESDIPFIRLGRKANIHKDIYENSYELLTNGFETVPELEQFVAKQKVVGSTCLAVSSHELFARSKTFDYCIVDEASQVQLLTCIGPLFYCKKFILVGDLKQLPPLVHSKQARDEGMGQSLFEWLQTQENTVNLTIQYRMNNEILKLSNQLTYENALSTDCKIIASATIKNEGASFGKEWIKQALDESLKSSVKFISTDQLLMSSNLNIEGAVDNTIELNIIKALVKELVEVANHDPREIGIITPYRKQVEKIRRTLSSIATLKEIEVNSVDQYQGRDKEVIMVSCVKLLANASGEGEGSSILSDARRLNVAITRARKKLIIVGSRSVLNTYGPFKALLDVLRDDQFIHMQETDL